MSKQQEQWQIWVCEDRPAGVNDHQYGTTIYKSKKQAEEIALFLNEQYARLGDNFYVKEVKKGEEKE